MRKYKTQKLVIKIIELVKSYNIRYLLLPLFSDGLSSWRKNSSDVFFMFEMFFFFFIEQDSP